MYTSCSSLAFDQKKYPLLTAFSLAEQESAKKNVLEEKDVTKHMTSMLQYLQDNDDIVKMTENDQSTGKNGYASMLIVFRKMVCYLWILCGRDRIGTEEVKRYWQCIICVHDRIEIMSTMCAVIMTIQACGYYDDTSVRLLMTIQVCGYYDDTKRLTMEKRAQGMSLQQRKDDLPEILRRFEQENMQKVAAEKYRCHFHLMAPVGWLTILMDCPILGTGIMCFFNILRLQ